MTHAEPSGPSVAARSSIPRLVKVNTVLIPLIQAASGAGLQLIPTLGALMIVRLLGGDHLGRPGGEHPWGEPAGGGLSGRNAD